MDGGFECIDLLNKNKLVKIPADQTTPQEPGTINLQHAGKDDQYLITLWPDTPLVIEEKWELPYRKQYEPLKEGLAATNTESTHGNGRGRGGFVERGKVS